jgi:hypothetical protein
MIKLKRAYSQFKTIVSSKTLQIIYGDLRSDSYHIMALDGQITYETFIAKDGGADQIDFEANIMPSITARISTEPDWDDMVTTFPSSVTELHTYKRNNVVVQTTLITYTNSSKTVISRIQKTRV